MDNILIVLIVLLVVAAAVIYILRAKKKGGKCIGCPDSKNCKGNCSDCVASQISER